jgi:hypothetical protein
MTDVYPLTCERAALAKLQVAKKKDASCLRRIATVLRALLRSALALALSAIRRSQKSELYVSGCTELAVHFHSAAQSLSCSAPPHLSATEQQDPCPVFRISHNSPNLKLPRHSKSTNN